LNRGGETRGENDGRQSKLSVIENGNANPSVEVAKKIAAVLGFDWVWFFDDKQNSKEPAPTGTEG